MSHIANPTAYLVQGDQLPSLEVQLIGKDNLPINLTGATVTVKLALPGGIVERAVTITDAALGKVRYDWLPGDSDTVGYYHGRFKILIGGLPLSVPNRPENFLTVVIGPPPTPTP